MKLSPTVNIAQLDVDLESGRTVAALDASRSGSVECDGDIAGFSGREAMADGGELKKFSLKLISLVLTTRKEDLRKLGAGAAS